MSILKETLPHFFSDLQNTICQKLESYEDTSFTQDPWKRDAGGGGLSCVVENGSVFDKGGVNVSTIKGSPSSDNELSMFRTLCKQFNSPKFNLENSSYFASGISLVLHPKNPYIPTVHMNYRYFELENEGNRIWWFGGGCDLTPYILDKDDAQHFHKTLKDTCDLSDPSYYPIFKQKCDNYFYIPHRNEHRGIGGIFFDYLHEKNPEHYVSLITQCGHAFLPSYIPILEKHIHTPYSDDEKKWQLYRRGRYVEFNLIYDRGTLFGLKTNGRVSSILMSLPSQVSWHYDEQSLSHQNNALMDVVSRPICWV
ncbi:oxygen-dependent coproporphyrinogen oxidase [Candidatus Marinamargulisbacteria bacterium SCGC AG-343-D04]|nr:oxygen-dependent coproporphyrinogen oxidase [Candidatus Marinamargulisbacteria bacterium SCGC AG-343-D04]